MFPDQTEAGVPAAGEAAGRPVGSNKRSPGATTSTTSYIGFGPDPLVYLAIILFVRDNCIK
jgi:hypothetical protein